MIQVVTGKPPVYRETVVDRGPTRRPALLDQDQLGMWLGLTGLPERASASGSGA